MVPNKMMNNLALGPDKLVLEPGKLVRNKLAFDKPEQNKMMLDRLNKLELAPNKLELDNKGILLQFDRKNRMMLELRTLDWRSGLHILDWPLELHTRRIERIRCNRKLGELHNLGPEDRTLDLDRFSCM